MPFNRQTARHARRRKGGLHRARYWQTKEYINLARATVARWIMRRRHWPESYLPEYMADLSDIADPVDTPSPRRR